MTIRFRDIDWDAVISTAEDEDLAWLAEKIRRHRDARRKVARKAIIRRV